MTRDDGLGIRFQADDWAFIAGVLLADAQGIMQHPLAQSDPYALDHAQRLRHLAEQIARQVAFSNG